MAAVAEGGRSARLGLAALALAGAGLLAQPALAGTPTAENRDRLDRTVRYLQDAQNPDGGFGGQPGTVSDPGFSAWAAIGLAAAGINPQDQRRPGGISVYDYLLGHAGELSAPNAECAHGSCTTELERALLVVDASGTSPHDFAGVDLVARLLDRQLPDGGFPHEAGSARAGMNDTIFAILALSPVAEPGAREAVRSASEWVVRAQNSDGSWPPTCPKVVAGCSAPGTDPRGEVDMTAAAVEALNAAGRHGGEAEEGAFAYLGAAQNLDGGFPELPGELESNVASTAWTVQAIWSAGQNPETWRTGAGGPSEEPLDFMASLQQADGHVRWRRSSDLNGIWMTAYVAPAFAGQPLPPPTPPRSSPPPRPPAGEKGVIAGGGGEGAPLFSRPKPQSQGRTPGGARVVSHDGLRAVDRSPVRRGANTVQPSGTELAEPAASQGEVTRVGAEPGSPASSGSPGSSGAGEQDGARGAGSRGQEVSGAVIGSLAGDGRRGGLSFGAPGLRGAATGDPGTGLAVGIGAAALLAALAGAGRERRRQAVLS